MKTSKRWTEEDDARLKQFYAAGVKSVDIAAILQRTRSAVHVRAQHLGVANRLARGDENPKWIAICAICEDGVPRSVRELSDLTGAKYNSIEHLLRLRQSRGHAHIVSYAPPEWRGPHRPLWLPVPGRDAVPPAVSERAVRRRELRAARAAAAKPVGPVPDMKIKRKVAPAQRVIGAPQHELVRALFGMGVAA